MSSCTFFQRWKGHIYFLNLAWHVLEMGGCNLFSRFSLVFIFSLNNLLCYYVLRNRWERKDLTQIKTWSSIVHIDGAYSIVKTFFNQFCTWSPFMLILFCGEMAIQQFVWSLKDMRGITSPFNVGINFWFFFFFEVI